MSPVAEAWREYREAAGLFTLPARRFLWSTLLTWIGLGVHQVLFNLYLVEGGFRESFVGHAVSALGVGLAVTALPAAWLTNRFGRRRCLIVGLLIEATALAARSLTIEPSLVIGAGFVAGAGQALIAIAAAPYLTEHSSARERTHLFSAFFAIDLLAMVAGSLLGGMLPHGLERMVPALDRFHAYRITLVVGLLFELAAVVPLLMLRGLREEAIVSTPDPDRRETGRRFGGIGVFAFLIGCGAGLVIPFMNLYFKTRFDCSSAQIGVIFSLAQVSTAIAALLGPAIARRHGRLRTAVASQLLSLPFLLTLGFERHLPVAVIAFWLRATFMQASMPLLNAFLMEALPPAQRARATSLMNLVWNTGWAVSATLSGALIQRFGYAVPFAITGSLYLVATLMFWLSFRNIADHGTVAAGGEALVTDEVKGARGSSNVAE
jgi:MFS family permease